MDEFRVIRLDTGGLVTRVSFSNLRPHRLDGVFRTLEDAEAYALDLVNDTNRDWMRTWGYKVQWREVSDWETL